MKEIRKTSQFKKV